MKSIFVIFCLVTGSHATADHNLQVISKKFSTNLNCTLENTDDGYNAPSWSIYTVCGYKQKEAFLQKIRGQFEVVLKVDGLDDYSRNILLNNKFLGEHPSDTFNIKVIGVKLSSIKILNCIPALEHNNELNLKIVNIDFAIEYPDATITLNYEGNSPRDSMRANVVGNEFNGYAIEYQTGHIDLKGDVAMVYDNHGNRSVLGCSGIDKSQGDFEQIYNL